MNFEPWSAAQVQYPIVFLDKISAETKLFPEVFPKVENSTPSSVWMFSWFQYFQLETRTPRLSRQWCEIYLE